MSASVLTFRNPNMAEAERTLAYYVLASVKPELFQSGCAVARASEVDRILAAIHAWKRGYDPQDRLDMAAHGDVLQIMDFDAQQAVDRRAKGGW